MRFTSTLSLGAALLLAPEIAAAAPNPAPAPSADSVGNPPADTSPAPATPGAAKADIVVIATRIPGQVETPQPPVATFNEEDIAALGASNLSDLLTKISPQTGSGRGRGGQPVILVNGMRIANFREMRNYPPEAIRRIEILPEETALRFGFPPDARVINFILKDHFRSRVVELNGGASTLGGYSTWKGEATLLKISGPNRISATATADETTPLSEADRRVIQTGPQPTYASDPNPAAFRSLIGRTGDQGANLSWTHGLGTKGLGGQISLNANVARTTSTTLSGLDLVTLAYNGTSALRSLSDPLARAATTTTYATGATLTRYFGGWQLTATSDLSHAEALTLIDRHADTSALVAAAAAGTLAIDAPLTAPAQPVERARSITDGATLLTTLTGHPLKLPAGPAALTLKSGFVWSQVASSDSFAVIGASRLRRGDFSLGANLALPLTSRRNKVGSALGDLTLNLSAGWDRLSDAGALTDWSAGLTWSPTAALGLQASYIVNQAAPSLAQLGAPQTSTYNVPVFDFTRGVTSLVTVISGGNPGLIKEQQRDLKLSANWQIPFLSNSSLLAEYFTNRSTDVSAAFPLLTPAIEAAFPGRVTRVNGQLVQVDERAVTFAEQTGSRLRWGINLSGALGKPAPDGGMMGGMFGGGGGGRGGGSRGRGGGGPRGGGMMGGPPNGQGRWSFAVYHTVQFTSRVLVAPGGPQLDLLGGDALTTGGTPRHGLEFNGGTFYRGFGGFLQGTWSAPTHVAASGLPGTSDLRFGTLTKINLALFADLGQQKQLVHDSKFFKGARVSFHVNNILNSRQKVTDPSGIVPLSYQPDLLDPSGRVISFEFRKLF